MSIVNVALAPDRQTATVVVDSRAGAMPGDVTKLFALPHMTACLAGRGTLAMTVTALHCAIVVPTFDELATSLGPGLDEAWRAVNNARAALDVATLPEQQEIVVCGWHDRARRFHTWSWIQERAADGFAFSECRSLVLAPCDAEFMARVERVCADRGDIDLLDITLDQVDWFRRRLGAGALYGGSLYAAQLSQNGVNMYRVGSCDEAASSPMRAVS